MKNSNSNGRSVRQSTGQSARKPAIRPAGRAAIRAAIWPAILAIALTALLLPGAAGCTTRQTASTETQATIAGATSVTAFGTIQCAEILTLALPVDVSIIEWYAIAGQNIPPRTAILKIDRARLLLIRDQFEQELAGLQAAKASCELQVAEAGQATARIQAALDALDIEKTLGLLDALARADTHSQRQACAAELLANLDQTASLDLYQALVALTADKYRVQSNARPLLLQKITSLQSSLQAQSVRLLDLQFQIHTTSASLLLLADKTAIIEDICTGQEVCGIGSFDREGVFSSGDRPLLLSSRQDGRTKVVAGENLAELACLDTIQLLVNIEEQLVSGVLAGAEAQISPLYNKGVVWLGTVWSISDRAEVINGETVIPVVIVTKEQIPGPGYNVVVKIKTKDG